MEKTQISTENMLLHPISHAKFWLRFTSFTLAFLVVVTIYCMMGYVTYPNRQPLSAYPLKVTYCRPQNYILFIKLPDPLPLLESISLTDDKTRIQEYPDILYKKEFKEVHKTGSTSVMNILQHYGLSKNLTFILPLVNNYLGKHTTLHLSPNILVPHDNRAINILCNHVTYNQTAFRAVLNGRRVVHGSKLEKARLSCNQNFITKRRRCGSKIDKNQTTIDINDYTLFTMIRRPLAQVISAAYYYNLFPGISADNLMESILRRPSLFTNNRMSFDLGLSLSHFHNSTKVQEFIKNIDADFDIVLLMEYFDESMVLLRRYLCWQISDILYIKRNNGLHRPRIKVSNEQHERFCKDRAPADCALYDYFRPRFWSAVHAQGSDFFNEVHHYRSLLSLVRDHCFYIQDQQFDPKQNCGFDQDGLNQSNGVGNDLNQNKGIGKNNDNCLRIAASKWHSEFSIGTKECNIMTMDELPLVDHIRKLQYGR